MRPHLCALTLLCYVCAVRCACPALPLPELLRRSAVVVLGEMLQGGHGEQRVKVRVLQVWEVKAGGLEKDSVVWVEGCVPLRREERYVFFMEPTNDNSTFTATFPPREPRRDVRRAVRRVLCPACVEPKLKDMRSVSVEEGKRDVLKCEPKSKQPITRFRWYKDEKELTKKNKPESITIKNKKNKNSSELHLLKVTESDAGSYRCDAYNSKGMDSRSANVTVIKAITSTTPSVRTSSHEKRCPESEEKFCVNGGTCFTLEVPPSNNKLFCRCLPGYSGIRCQDSVPMKVMKPKQHLGIEFMEAEELYQKQVLTITGICIALLVVGIMCVVAYCKTKKQRKKLHDRLRQSLRTDRNGNANMASVANGPHITSPPTEDIQLVNQYVTQSAPAEHTIEKETETSFSTSQYTSSANASTTVTQASNPSRNNGRPESIVLPESHTVPVPSSVENSRHSTPSRRGRLNGTGGARDLSAYLKNSRDTPESLKDSPYSERYVSAMTTPTRMSPVELLSPPSEVSAPLSSLATSVPSMSVSPQCEERPLLFSTPPRLRDHSHGRGDARHQRSSAHYNHGLEAHSAPPSPQRAPEDEEYETTQEYHVATQPAEPVAEGAGAKRTKTSSQATLNTDSSSESSSSESETEDERVGEDTPFLSIQNPLCASLETAAPFSPGDSSRTNAGLRLSPPEDLQARLSSVIANQDPIAV